MLVLLNLHQLSFQINDLTRTDLQRRKTPIQMFGILEIRKARLLEGRILTTCLSCLLLDFSDLRMLHAVQCVENKPSGTSMRADAFGYAFANCTACNAVHAACHLEAVQFTAVEQSDERR